MKKSKAKRSKIQEKHMTSTSLLMFSPEFNLERELWNTSVLSSHNWIKTQNLIICRQVKDKKKPLTITIKQNHITFTYMLLNTAISAIFWAIIYIWNSGAIYGHRGKSNFILTFLLEGCLEYQIYQVHYLQSNRAGFGGYKIIR